MIQGKVFRALAVKCLLLFIMLCQHANIVAQTQHGTSFEGIPDRRDAFIYQVNLRVFSKEGNLRGVIARLDSIDALGVNVIYLMPIYPVGKVRSVNSPYCIRDYTSVSTGVRNNGTI